MIRVLSVNLVRCIGSCNALNDLSNKVPVPKKTEYLNLSIFNMIIGINESKPLTKHISYQCKCKFDGKKCNLNQNWNNDKCRCKCKNSKKHHRYEKDCIWNPALSSCKNGRYLSIIIYISVPTNFNEKKGNL